MTWHFALIPLPVQWLSYNIQNEFLHDFSSNITFLVNVITECGEAGVVILAFFKGCVAMNVT